METTFTCPSCGETVPYKTMATPEGEVRWCNKCFKGDLVTLGHVIEYELGECGKRLLNPVNEPLCALPDGHEGECSERGSLKHTLSRIVVREV